MKFTLPFTFDIDLGEWADEYGLPSAEAAVTDIVEVLTRHAGAGALADALLSQWPMMRDAATVTVGPVTAQDGEIKP